MRVVVNPGHHPITDPGATGPTGLRERDVVREVTLALCPLAAGEIVYEPKRQGLLGLYTLTWALHRNPADVVVSLHCDSAEHPPCIHECRVIYWTEDLDRARAERSRQLAESIRVHAQGTFAEKARLLSAPYARRRRDGSTYQLTPGILVRTAKLAAVAVELNFVSDIHVETQMRTAHWVVRAAVALNAGVRYWAGTPERERDG